MTAQYRRNLEEWGKLLKLLAFFYPPCFGFLPRRPKTGPCQSTKFGKNKTNFFFHFSADFTRSRSRVLRPRVRNGATNTRFSQNIANSVSFCSWNNTVFARCRSYLPGVGARFCFQKTQVFCLPVNIYTLPGRRRSYLRMLFQNSSRKTRLFVAPRNHNNTPNPNFLKLFQGSARQI